MVERTIDRFYPTYAEAVQVVADLTSAGVPPDNVSLIESELDGRLPQDVVTSTPQNPVVTGASTGAAIGGAIGALDGVGAITIPYTDSLVATGWVLPCVVFAIIFAILGTIVGAIVQASTKNKAGRGMATRLQQGQQLVMVRVAEEEVARVTSIMARTHQVPAAAYQEDILDDGQVAPSVLAVPAAERRSRVR